MVLSTDILLILFTTATFVCTEKSLNLDARGSCGDSQHGDYLYDAPIPGLSNYHSRHRRRRSVVANPDRLWSHGRIPYVFDNGISGAGQRLITKAMRHWENGTCVKFVKRTNEEDYVLIYRGRGCCSHVGKLGGRQKLSLGTGCLRFGIIVHELGHTIGFYHEQNRPDRSSYIDILYNNVEHTKYANFDMKAENEVETFDQAYDYKSIMHYGAKFFSKNGYDTIRAKAFHNINPNSIGEAYYSYSGPVLSKQDVIKTNLLYKCNKTVAFSDCGGSLSKQSGYLQIKGTFLRQKDAKDCVWIVSGATSNQIIRGNTSLSLHFKTFQVGEVDPKTGTCKDAYLEIRKGKGFLSPLIGQFCGKTLMKPIVDISDTMYVRLHILPSLTNKLITINTKARYKTDVCSGRLTALRGILQSPEYPRPYKSDLDCIWHINVRKGFTLTIQFITFLLHEFQSDLECTDYVDIYEGSLNGEHVGRFCGSTKPGPFHLRSNSVVLVFHSGANDIGIRGLGFSAYYEAKDINECADKTHTCQHVCANYPGGYSCACYNGYRRLQLPGSDSYACIDVDECLYRDGLCSHKCVNTDGSYFCSCPSGYYLSPNKTTCLDSDECSAPQLQCSQKCHNFPGGFRCSCKAGYLLGNDGTTCSVLPLCGGKLSLPLGTLKSPLIPLTHEHGVVCRWKVHTGLQYNIALQINIPWRKNPDCKSYLILKRKSENDLTKEVSKICSFYDIGDEIIVKGNSFVLEYHATPPFLPPFEVKYQSIAEANQACNKILNSTFDWFRTPGYPFRYPYNADCKWHIFASETEIIKLVFTDFELEDHINCNFDYVEIEEHSPRKRTIKFVGRFCGNKKPKEVISSLGSELIVKFHSDSTVSQRGFKAIALKATMR